MVRPRHGAALGPAPRLAAGPVRRPGAVPVPRRLRPVSAYVKISDGCDRRCAYCAIPLIKGDYETVAAAEVLRSARAALAAGARELVLVGQDTSRWAQPGWGGASRLLVSWRAWTRPVWLRLLYLQPDGIDDDLALLRRSRPTPSRGRPPPARLRRRSRRRMRRSVAHLALSGVFARLCPAPPCARPSSPGFPARPTRSSTSSSPSCARPALRRRGLRLRRARGYAAAGMTGPCLPGWRSSAPPSSARPSTARRRRSGAGSPARRSTSSWSAERHAPARGDRSLRPGRPDIDGRTLLRRPGAARRLRARRGP